MYAPNGTLRKSFAPKSFPNVPQPSSTVFHALLNWVSAKVDACCCVIQGDQAHTLKRTDRITRARIFCRIRHPLGARRSGYLLCSFTIAFSDNEFARAYARSDYHHLSVPNSRRIGSLRCHTRPFSAYIFLHER